MMNTAPNLESIIIAIVVDIGIGRCVTHKSSYLSLDNGSIDDVSFWNEELTADDAAALAAGTSPPHLRTPAEEAAARAAAPAQAATQQ